MFYNWNFEVTGFAENFQLTKYEKGNKYDMHVDAGLYGTPMPRKLSIVVQLSDPNDYEGGELDILCTDGDIEMLRGQGDVIVFPSYMYHKVREVTKGTRYSLVSWVGGPPFR